MSTNFNLFCWFTVLESNKFVKWDPFDDSINYRQKHFWSQNTHWQIVPIFFFEFEHLCEVESIWQIFSDEFLLSCLLGISSAIVSLSSRMWAQYWKKILMQSQWQAPIAQWFCRCLHSYGPGSNPNHDVYALNCLIRMWLSLIKV